MRKVFFITIAGFLLWMLISGVIVCLSNQDYVFNMAPMGELKIDLVKYDYRVIECNVVGSNEIDYVVETVTRDPEEVEEICVRLGGVQK